MTRAGKKTAVACAISGLLAFLVFAWPLLHHFHYFGRDLDLTDGGFLCELKNRLAEHTRFWISPYIGNGQPLFADPQAQLLYPIRWLELLMPVSWGVSFSVIFHLTLSAIGATWLLRTFRIPTFESICGGLSFVFTGTVLDLITHSVFILGAAYLPWIWASARVTLRKSSRRDSLGPPRLIIAILVVSQLFCLWGGEPQAFVMGAALIFIECGSLLTQSPKPALKRVWIPILCIVSAFLLGMLQWSTTFEELRLTGRNHGLRYFESLNWSFDPVMWFATLWPDIIKDVTLYKMSAHANTTNPIVSFWNLTPYLGSLLLALGLGGLFVRKNRSAKIAVFFFLILALGGYTPVLPLLMKVLPLLKGLRYPSKYLLAFNLAWIVLATSMTSALIKRTQSRARLAMLMASICILGIQTFYYSAFSWLSHPSRLFWAPFLADSGDLYGKPYSAGLKDLLKNAIFQSSAPLIGAVLIAMFVPRARRLIPVFLVLSLLLAGLNTLDTGPAIFEISSPLTVLKQKNQPPPVLCYSPTLWPVALRAREAKSNLILDGGLWAMSFFKRAVLFSNVNACDAMSSVMPYSPLTTPLERALENGMWHEQNWGAVALGCTYLVSDQPLEKDWGTQVSIPDLDSIKLRPPVATYQLKNPIPEVFVSTDPLLLGPVEATFPKKQSHDGLQLIKTIEDPMERWSYAQVLPRGLGVKSVQLQNLAPDRFIIQANGIGGAVLGVRKKFSVGWSATQAGQQLPVLRAAINQLAVAVPFIERGPIYFVYEPPGLKRGLVLALLGLTILASLLCFPQLRKLQSRGRVRKIAVKIHSPCV